MRFTRTGLENLTNQAVHEIVEERKKKPLETEESNEISQAQEPKKETKESKASFTYGTNSETSKMLFNGSYHTFSTNSSNQMQCTCCPEPILFNVKEDLSKKEKDNYLSTSLTTSSSYSTLDSKKKSGFIY